MEAGYERGLSRAAEAFGIRAAAQPVSPLGAHIDVARDAADAARISERADEGFLAGRGLSVVPVFGGYAVEGGKVFGGYGNAGFSRVFAAWHGLRAPDRGGQPIRVEQKVSA